MAEVRVLIADDHPVVRHGLRSFLELQDGLEVVGEASDGAEAVSMASALRPDVVLLDLVMPPLDGVEAIATIRERAPDAKVIVLTTFADDRRIFPALRAGAAGYLLKDVDPHDLVRAIRQAHRGEPALHPAVAARLVREVALSDEAARPAGPGLTARETEVLRHLARGMSNREIARSLHVSEKTVKTHVSNILSKLGVADRTQAALYAVREGLAEPA